MAAYVDDAIWPLAGRRWCHLLADDIFELHRFASLLGLKQASYQGPPKTSKPHYDITAFERDKALRLGAIAITRQDVIPLVRKLQAQAKTGH